MFFYLGIFALIIIIFYLVKNKVVIHLPSFFKKGFQLTSNKFGCYCATGKQRFSARHYML